MKRYLLFVLTMLCVSIGAWADETINFGTACTISYNWVENQDWYDKANIKIATGETTAFATWFYGTSTDVSKLMKVKSSAVKFGGDNSTITMGSGTITLTGGNGNDEWSFNNPAAAINSSTGSELQTWLEDATNGTKNQFIFNAINASNVTLSGTNPEFTFGSNSSKFTLKTVNGKLIADVELGSGDNLSDWTSSTLGSSNFFSNVTYRIYINDAKTSYIDLGSYSATVHSANDTDFQTWLSSNSSLVSSVSSFTFDGDTKLTTNGDNYVTINGTTATVPTATGTADFVTWAGSNLKYLSNVTAVNFTEESTYTIATGTTVTFDTSGNATVSGNLTDFNTWKSNDVGKKILNGKTIKYDNAQLSDQDGCYISMSEDGKTATVHCPTAGHFATHYNNWIHHDAAYDGITFRFDSQSNINLDDLKAIMADQWTQYSNKYYVDLYDLPASFALCDDTNGVIGQWIDWMRTQNLQVKGLILPKNHTLYGSGTTLIKDADGANPAQATCSEFIAYYKTKDNEGNDLTQQSFVAHVYNQTPTAADAYQASYEKMLSLVDAHVKDGTSTPEVKTDADIVLISSNSATKLNSSSTSIPNATRVEIINNEMVGTQTGKASVYVYPNAAGTLASAKASTGMAATPTELLQVNGAMNSDDFTALNEFTDGPRVLDLRNVTSTITKAMLESLANSKIEYILLPQRMANRADVCGPTYSSSMTSLKCVIASTSTNCVAYVKTAGSLAEARYLATGGSIVDGTSLFSPTKLGLTSVTLAGNLNAADIACNLTTYHTTADGHWKNTSGDEASVGLSQETGITSIDLADAVFVNKVTTTSGGTTSYADMNLAWAGLANLSDIKLPTSTEMKDIPESCCEGMASLKELCIPHNYENIHNAAFLNTIIEHITTTDAQGMLVDNGPNTYTLSANVKQIGDEPATTDGLTATQTVFPQNRPVYDCYVLATKTPICYKNAFPANMLYGWGGFDGTLPYCRDKYVNGTNYYCVLRFPSQESYDNVESADKKDTSYDLMKKQYTDVTKVYSKKEQTGAVDANGDEITWPTFSELRRAYNQATAGITWNRWVANYDGQQEVNGGENIPTAATGLTLGHYTSADGTANNNLGDYTFENYEGWHQFTLSQATYVDPDETLTREYEDAGWFTFCIPYDMTKKQVREWLGVPASEGNIIRKYDDTEVTTPMMPDIRQLQSVTRHTSTGGTDKNKVTFRLTTNQYSDGVGHYLNFTRANEGATRFTTAAAGGTDDSEPCLRGGIPYIIKAYKRKGEKIKSYNLGQYIMTHYGDKFKLTQACLNHGNQYYEYLGTKGGDIATLKFSKPYEEAVVVAANDAQSGSYCTYMDGNTERPYEYALVGTFWNQKLPRYCFYQSKGTWYRNTNVNTYQWSAYKCVIMAVPAVNKDVASYDPFGSYENHIGQNYRENPSALGTAEDGKSFYPSIEANTTDKLNGTLKIVFADGRDDDDFQANARYAFAFDDGIMEYDENGEEVTAIDRLDGGDIVPTDGKVYNMAGQYVGNNLNALGSGLYIVNGKKIVVK